MIRFMNRKSAKDVMRCIQIAHIIAAFLSSVTDKGSNKRSSSDNSNQNLRAITCAFVFECMIF